MALWKKVSLSVLVLGLAVVLFATPLGTIISYKLFPSYPKIGKESLKLKNLNKEVKVYFDEYGIPHIEAQNLADLVRATGFIHARYRFFQLDVLRRFASGRLSELVGNQKALSSSTVDFDLAMRGWGFVDRVKIDLDTLPEVDRTIITAFSDGVNQGMKEYPSVEHKILGIEPEPWRYEDTLLVSLLQAWSITHNWEQEAVKFALALSLGKDIALETYPQEPLYEVGTLARKSGNKELPPGIVEELDYLLKNPKKIVYNSPNKINSALGDIIEMKPSASNAWVVSGKLSKSGKPILSNDMHLTHALPSMLFLQHLKMPGLNIIGTTMPGLPFMINGYNGHITWGSTAAVADVVDLVVEKEDPKRDGYVLNQSQDCKLEDREISIKVKGEEDKKFRLRKTCNGHIFNDMYPNFLPKNSPLLAVRFKIPKVQESFGHLYRANRSKTVYELRDNLMKIPNPIQNITAADKDGNIGFFTTGSVPLRENHRGTFPIPGWLKKYDWGGWTQPKDMPAGFNPEVGFLANGNNLVQDPNKNWPIFHIEAAPNYRFERIKDRIKILGKHTQESLQSIQTDTFLKRAQLVAPLIIEELMSISSWNSQELKASEMLQKWDYNADKESIGMTIFMATYRKAVLMALANKVSEETRYVFTKQRYSTNIVDGWFTKKYHPIWDDYTTENNKEDKSFIIVQAFRAAIKDLEKNLGKDISKWQWGKLHYFKPQHLFGGKKILSFFNLDRIPLSGSLDSVWKAHFNLSNKQDPFKTVAGPVTRLIIDLAQPEKAMFSIDTGQSGWPLDPHYGDQYEKWQKGELIPMIRDMEKVKKRFANRSLTLAP